MIGGLTVEGLTFSYGPNEPPAVAGTDLSVGPGEVVAVVGPSGSGKTTLLRLVAGLLAPSAGRIAVGGAEVSMLAPEARPVAMLFQGFALFPHLDVAANIGFGLAVRKVGRAERRRLVEEIAGRLGIESLLRRRPGEVSGGERQRVALARALLRDPAVFLLDEPLSSLDPMLRDTARRELDEVLRRDGRCALYVTHDQADANALADRVAVMRDGRFEQVGTPGEVYEHPATTFVASFIGTPPMSLLPAGSQHLPTPPGAVTIGVRAEHVALIEGDAAVVTRVMDLGHELVAELDLSPGVVFARLSPDQRVPRGVRTGLAVDAGHVHGFDADGVAVR